MSYGIVIKNANGVTQLDTANMGFELVDSFLITLANGSSGSVSYPQLAGGSINCRLSASKFTQVGGGDWVATAAPSITITYSSGYPILYWSYPSNFTLDCIAYVTVVTLPASNYGLKISNDAGTILLTDQYSSYSKYATVTSSAVAMPAQNYVIGHIFDMVFADITENLNTHQATFTIPAGGAPIFMVDVPDYPNGVQIRRIEISGNTYTVKLVGVGVTPVVHAFVKQTSIGVSSGYALRLRNSSNQVTTDTGRQIFGLTPSVPQIYINCALNDVTYLNVPLLPAKPMLNACSCGHLYYGYYNGDGFFGYDQATKVYAKVWSKSSSTQLRCDFRQIWNTTYFYQPRPFWMPTISLTASVMISNKDAYV